MRTMILMALCAAGLSSSCTFAAVEARKNGFYHVNGYSTNPSGAARTFSDNYVQEINAETYRDAVRNGQAYPYSSGGYGNDYWYYYGSQGVMPSAPQHDHHPHYEVDDSHAQQTADEALETADEALETARVAQKKADVSIRALKRQREIELQNAR